MLFLLEGPHYLFKSSWFFKAYPISYLHENYAHDLHKMLRTHLPSENWSTWSASLYGMKLGLYLYFSYHTHQTVLLTKGLFCFVFPAVHSDHSRNVYFLYCLSMWASKWKPNYLAAKNKEPYIFYLEYKNLILHFEIIIFVKNLQHWKNLLGLCALYYQKNKANGIFKPTHARGISKNHVQGKNEAVIYRDFIFTD